jgi:hypothetical protein
MTSDAQAIDRSAELAAQDGRVLFYIMGWKTRAVLCSLISIQCYFVRFLIIEASVELSLYLLPGVLTSVLVACFLSYFFRARFANPYKHIR